MEKDFDGWNKIKKRVHAEKPRLYNTREIWWCRLGLNIGTEQDGKNEWYTRPCLILRGFGPHACLVIPLTTSKRQHPLRLPLGLIEGREAHINLSQMRVIDTRRLRSKICFLDKDIYADIRKAVRQLF